MSKLSDKATLIVGLSEASVATARLFCSEGAKVFMIGRSASRLRALKRDIGGQFQGFAADITQSDELSGVYANLLKKTQKLDFLFVSTCLGSFQRVEDFTEEEFDRVFGLNVKATAFCVQKAIPLLAEGASVLLNGSFLDVESETGFGAYQASKAALRSFVQTWSREMEGRHIRFNVLSPRCDPARRAPCGDPLFSRTEARQKSDTVSQLAETILFLASSDSAAVNNSQVTSNGYVSSL